MRRLSDLVHGGSPDVETGRFRDGPAGVVAMENINVDDDWQGGPGGELSGSKEQAGWGRYIQDEPEGITLRSGRCVGDHEARVQKTTAAQQSVTIADVHIPAVSAEHCSSQQDLADSQSSEDVFTPVSCRSCRDGCNNVLVVL